jgi:hypothetical protein
MFSRRDPLLTSVNPDVDANFTGAHGIKKVPLWDKIKDKLYDIKETGQHFKHITESEYPVIYDKLRLFEAVPDRVKKEAYERIASFIRPLGQNREGFEAFERHIVLQDLIHDIDNTKLFENKELPWGYNTADEIRQDASNTKTYLMRHPVVMNAYLQRQAMMEEIKKQLVDNKILADNGNDSYFHHQVLEYMQKRLRPDVGVSSRDVRNHKKGWQRSRTGSMADYNTNYLESEFEVMAQSLEQIEIKALLKEIGAEINIMPSLVEKSEIENEKIAQHNIQSNDPKDWKKFTTWRDFVPEDHVQWSPQVGTHAYKAASAVEKAVQNILNDPTNPDLMALLEEAEGSLWVIPKKVAVQLNSMKDAEKESFIPAGIRKVTGKWKQWILLNPYSAIKYNFNNMSGDLDIVMAYNPAILKPKYAHTAMKEAWAELQGKGMSQDMKEALEYGIITSGLSIQEIPDINQQSLFRSIVKGNGNFAQKAWNITGGKYWDITTSYTQFRENILRVAAYKYFKERLAQGGVTYAASDKKAIDALMNSKASTKEVAGKLARELVGDYGNLSQGGQWLRSHSYPFWSWVEINSPRYYRLLKNTAYEGNQAGTVGRIIGVGAKKTAVNVTKYGIKAMLLMALVVLWNMTMFPDEDEEL